MVRRALCVPRLMRGAWRVARLVDCGCGGGVPTWVAAKLTIDMVRMAVVA